MASNLADLARFSPDGKKTVVLDDLSKLMIIGVGGEMLVLKLTVHPMVAQLWTPTNEVTCVSFEVGMGGIHDRQVFIPGV